MCVCFEWVNAWDVFISFENLLRSLDVKKTTILSCFVHGISHEKDSRQYSRWYIYWLHAIFSIALIPANHSMDYSDGEKTISTRQIFSSDTVCHYHIVHLICNQLLCFYSQHPPPFFLYVQLCMQCHPYSPFGRCKKNLIHVLDQNLIISIFCITRARAHISIEYRHFPRLEWIGWMYGSTYHTTLFDLWKFIFCCFNTWANAATTANSGDTERCSIRSFKCSKPCNSYAKIVERHITLSEFFLYHDNRIVKHNTYSVARILSVKLLLLDDKQFSRRFCQP